MKSDSISRKLLAKNLMYLREKKNITPYRVAKDCSIAYTYYREIEKGEESNPSMEILDLLAAYFDVPVHELFLKWGKNEE